MHILTFKNNGRLALVPIGHQCFRIEHKTGFSLGWRDLDPVPHCAQRSLGTNLEPNSVCPEAFGRILIVHVECHRCKLSDHSNLQSARRVGFATMRNSNIRVTTFPLSGVQFMSTCTSTALGHW